MRFTGFESITSLSLLAIAGLTLVALHSLRSHPNRVRVVTTLFWESARSAVQPRWFRHRFRQWLSFLLFLLMAVLCVLSTSKFVMSLGTSKARHVVIVLDAGMSMQAKNPSSQERRFDQAIKTAREVLDTLSSDDRLAVMVVDPLPRFVYRFDQPCSAARLTLSSLEPADEPADVTSAMTLAQSMLVGRRNATLVHITDRQFVTGTSPPDEPKLNLVSIQVGEPSSNAAILSALFVTDEQDPRQGRLQVRTGWWGGEEGTITLHAESIPAGEVLIDRQMTLPPGDTVDVFSSPLRAYDQTIRLTLAESGGIRADNQLEIRLPIRDDILIAADPDLPASLKLALAGAATRSIEPNEHVATIHAFMDKSHSRRRPQSEIIVVTKGDSLPSESRVQVVSSSVLTENLSLENAVCGAGPGLDLPVENDRITPLLSTGGTLLAALDETVADQPRLWLSAALFSQGTTVPNHPAFAILISRAVRHLAGWSAPPAPIPVDRVWSDPVWINEMKKAYDLLLVAGDRNASNISGASEAATKIPSLSRGHWPPLSQFLLLLALVLMVADAILHARGRIA